MKKPTGVVLMADKISPEVRSRNMRAIRSQSKMENRLPKELWKKGIRFRKNAKTLFGKPDISIKKYKIVIFVGSCFWHVCPIHGNRPKSNQEFWDKKLLRNQERDREVTEYYLEKGWHIKRIWEHEIKKDINQVVDELVDFINKVRLSGKSNSLMDIRGNNPVKDEALPMLAAEESDGKHYGRK
ncbi:MAG: very short patch repair endonuclease [Psychrobacillus psychrodurans]